MALTYSVGTIALTNGSATVTGTGTSWNAAIVPGWLLRAPDGKVYAVTAVNSDTSITIAPNYEGSTASGQAYVLLASGGINTDLATRLQALITDYATIYNTTGQGKFPDGTVSLPGLQFSADADTGIRRSGSNAGALVAGGVDRIEWNSAGAVITGQLSGSAVQSNAWDATAGRLLKTGAANLLLNDATAATVLEATGADSMNACRLSGPWRYTSSTTGRPTGSAAGMFWHIPHLSGQDAGRHQQIALPSEGGVLYRNMADASGNWSAWQPFLFAGALASVSAVDIGGARHGGVQVTIADDAVYTFTPARKGGLIYIGSQTNTDFPALGDCALFQYDVGNSIQAAPINIGVVVDVLTTGVDLTATPGADGRITVSLRSNGTMQFNNRTGGSRALSIHTFS